MSIPDKKIRPQHFLWQVEGKVGIATLNRPKTKNALTFDSYRELASVFHELASVPEVSAVVLTGAGQDFCSGGDVHEIIGPLVEFQEQGRTDRLLEFTRMTGEVVKAMRACPQPIVAAIDGVCAGAGAILAMAADLRIGTSRSRVAFLFVRVGLSGADMGACAMLPRIIGLGRASELLFTGRFMEGEEAERWGFYSRLAEPDRLFADAVTLAQELAGGPSAAHATTKRCLDQEWDMPLSEAIEAEAKSQALCMQTKDFARAYRAFIAKESPRFEGN